MFDRQLVRPMRFAKSRKGINPPPGYSPAPQSKQGSYRRKVGDRYDYWKPGEPWPKHAADPAAHTFGVDAGRALLAARPFTDDEKAAMRAPWSGDYRVNQANAAKAKEAKQEQWEARGKAVAKFGRRGRADHPPGKPLDPHELVTAEYRSADTASGRFADRRDRVTFDVVQQVQNGDTVRLNGTDYTVLVRGKKSARHMVDAQGNYAMLSGERPITGYITANTPILAEPRWILKTEAHGTQDRRVTDVQVLSSRSKEFAAHAVDRLNAKWGAEDAGHERHREYERREDEREREREATRESVARARENAVDEHLRTAFIPPEHRKGVNWARDKYGGKRSAKWIAGIVATRADDDFWRGVKVYGEAMAAAEKAVPAPWDKKPKAKKAAAKPKPAPKKRAKRAAPKTTHKEQPPAPKPAREFRPTAQQEQISLFDKSMGPRLVIKSMPGAYSGPAPGSAPRHETPPMPDYELWHQPEDSDRERRDQEAAANRRRSMAERNRGTVGFQGIPPAAAVLRYEGAEVGELDEAPEGPSRPEPQQARERIARKPSEQTAVKQTASDDTEDEDDKSNKRKRRKRAARGKVRLVVGT